MDSRRFWLKVLNVYPEEWLIVRRLYLLQFFQGAGIAFFFTSAFAQFLGKFPITKLPWVMIFSAALLWGTGYLYAKLEHSLSFRKFNIGTLVFTTISMLVFWLININVTGDWFFYLLMTWYYVLYMLDNLGFWGLAALYFDVRQSKRLFAVISAGDIPAKFVGYTLALIVVPYTGTKTLMLIGACCMLVSLPSLVAILKSGKHEEHTHGENNHQQTQERSKPRKISKLVSNLITNTYIRRIALISLITSCCVILFNYGLYGEVTKAYHEDVELATFIAFFYGSIRVLAFITKMIFTSRVTVLMGVRPALFITPVGMMVLIASIIVVGNISQDHKLVFYLFGISSIVVEVLRTSFNTPVLLTIMQPLPVHERMRAHNIVKGIMDPFASFISGIVLLIFYYLGRKADIIHLCYGLFGLGAVWLIGVVLVNRRYVSLLINTISSRYFSRDEFQLNDEAVMAQVKKRIENGSELEVISILNMLNSKKIDKVAEELILELLHHPSDRIRIEAIHVVGSRNFTNARSGLEKLFTDKHESVRTEAIKVYCKISPEENQVLNYLLHQDDSVRYAALTGMITNNKVAIRHQAEITLTKLLFTQSVEEKKRAISILKEVGNWYSYPEHAMLIENSDYGIADLAIKAIGTAAGRKTLLSLFGKIGSHEKSVLDALYNAGESSVHLIKEQLKTASLHLHLQDKLITLLGKIGGENAIRALVQLLPGKKHTTCIIRALHRCKYSADENTRKELESIARTYIAQGVELLHMQQALSRKQQHHEVISDSLYYEIQKHKGDLTFYIRVFV